MYIKDGICYAGELTPEIEVASIKLLEDGFMLIDFSTGETRLFALLTRLIDHPVHDGSLTMVHMGDDCDVSYILHILLKIYCHSGH